MIEVNLGDFGLISGRMNFSLRNLKPPADEDEEKERHDRSRAFAEACVEAERVGIMKLCEILGFDEAEVKKIETELREAAEKRIAEEEQGRKEKNAGRQRAGL